jgi:glycosyltransferase involved in cell wall biosynthesis
MSHVYSPLAFSTGRARNLGMRLARGEYLAFLDEDNTFHPEHLAALVNAIERSGTLVAATSSRCIIENADDKLLAFSTLAELDIHRTPADSPEISLIGAALSMNAVMFSRSVIDKIGTFDERLLILDDFDYLLRLERATPLALSPSVTLDVRVRVELNNALGAYLTSYVAYLDGVYERHPVDAPLTAKRAVHRAAVERAIGAVVGQTVGIAQISRLLATLCGRDTAAGAA